MNGRVRDIYKAKSYSDEWIESRIKESEMKNTLPNAGITDITKIIEE